MDECRSSVCGDSVQPHIFDEPDLTYNDLDLLPTPVEDPERDEGPKDEPESTTSTVEPSSIKNRKIIQEKLDKALILPPTVIISRRKKTESFVDYTFKCAHCTLPIALQSKYSLTAKPVNYHLMAEFPVAENEECVDQIFMSCLNVSDEIKENMMTSLLMKYAELME